MKINTVTKDIFSNAVALIKKSDLPTEDISDSTKLFAATDGNEVVGTIGIELFNKVALLRSLAVGEERRNAGIAKQLVGFIEQFAKQNAVEEIVLLTTTAQNYFLKTGYVIIERENTPEAIKKTTEFNSVCPSSAIIMKKRL